MSKLRVIFILCTALLVAACRHPLQIVGAGDIVETSGSGRGCTLEQFQQALPTCTKNNVSGDYQVNYIPRPAKGWRFVRWDGSCPDDGDPSSCRYNVPASVVREYDETHPDQPVPPLVAIFEAADAGLITLSDLPSYSDQSVPFYITKDNTADNPISDAGATLGRVLFYDKQLSSNGKIACASCHQQAFAFSDPRPLSVGVNGKTQRHSPRLVNARFSEEARFFLDERAATLEEQATQPIRDHLEMGFSGKDGAPSMADLITRMKDLDYYPPLFAAAFGDEQITESRMQLALAQFVRSIQSFDSRYDRGLDMAGGDLHADFPNFSALENQGKKLFMRRPNLSSGENLNGDGSDRGIVGVRRAGGLGCVTCHAAPEFSISPTSGNNGVITSAAGDIPDLSVTRSPTLRDLFSPNGSQIVPVMHDGSMTNFDDVLDHYNDIVVNISINPLLDVRLSGDNTASPRTTPLAQAGPGQKLQIQGEERAAITAFMKTLTGQRLYRDARWASPFDQQGRLTVVE